jgi:hypothetical protein
MIAGLKAEILIIFLVVLGRECYPLPYGGNTYMNIVSPISYYN